MNFGRTIRAGARPASRAAAAAAIVLVAAIAGPSAATAGDRTVTIALAMTCPASDPELVTLVLKRTPGVKSVRVSYENQAAVIVFDDAATNTGELRAAIDGIGFLPKDTDANDR